MSILVGRRLPLKDVYIPTPAARPSGGGMIRPRFRTAKGFALASYVLQKRSLNKQGLYASDEATAATMALAEKPFGIRC